LDSDEQVMMEPFPSTWKDTPKKQAHWAQMLRNNAFLQQQKCLQCHYCHKAVRIAHWSENYIGSDVATVDHITSFLLLGVALTIPQTCLLHVSRAT
jgi:succinate dehydrogenase/fumarate reductase-like Fe-S protein